MIAGSASAASPQRPKVDTDAMNEAMVSAESDGPSASSSAYAHYLRAMEASFDGDARTAVNELRLSLVTDDSNPFLLTALAEQHVRLSESARAERELSRALALHPGYAPAHRLLGRLLYETRKPGGAQGALRRAIALDPAHPDPYLLLAQMSLERGRPNEAVRQVQALARALPDDALGFKRLGMVFAERGDRRRAETMLRAALGRDPGDGESWTILAQVLEAQGRHSECEEALGRALERDPDNRELLLSAGRAALRIKAKVRARAYFDRLLLLADETEWTVKVALSYLAARDLSGGAEVLDASRARKRGEPRVAFYAGLVHER
ncbi:MAG TPA: tetratricopeptide repeat protein, partial [Myxococcaceae bacterium]|nr:tetratricopeptide repeat protein [Myxococcaceae bacterium]